MNIKGLSTRDILSMDYNDIRKLNEKEMKTLTSRLVSTANKRIRQLEKTKHGKWSYAYKKVKDMGRKFSVRNKDLKQTQQEFKNVKQFLEMKTSSAKNWNKSMKEMEERVSNFTGGESIQWSDRTWSKYWEVYRKFEENHGGTFKKGDSDRWQEKLTEMFFKGDKRKGKVYFSEMIESEWEDLQDNPEDFDEDEEDDGVELDY